MSIKGLTPALLAEEKFLLNREFAEWRVLAPDTAGDIDVTGKNHLRFTCRNCSHVLLAKELAVNGLFCPDCGEESFTVHAMLKRESVYLPTFHIRLTGTGEHRFIHIDGGFPGGKIHYTTDDSPVTLRSAEYKHPVLLHSSFECIRAVCYDAARQSQEIACDDIISVQEALRRGRSLLNCAANNHDRLKAFRCLKKAANAGEREAEYLVGLCYANAWGIEASWEYAVEWYLRAAQKNMPEAQWAYGLCVRDGLGFNAPNPELAFNWMCASAGQGYAPAQYECGVALYQGLGVPKDTNAALKSLQLAAEQGYAPALEYLRRVSSPPPLPTPSSPKPVSQSKDDSDWGCLWYFIVFLVTIVIKALAS